MQEKKCVLIAPLVSHATAGRIAALIATGYQVTLIDISSRSNAFPTSIYPYSSLYKIYKIDIREMDSFYSSPSLASIIRDIFRSYNIIKENKSVIATLRNIFLIEDPWVVVTFYGPLGIHFSRLVKKINPQQKTVFIANLIPSTLLSGNAFMRCLKKNLVNEFVDFRRWIRKIDFIICASDEMEGFIKKKFGYAEKQLTIAPDFHPASFQVTEEKIQQTKPAGNGLRLIFLGAPERWGGQMDNIDAQLNAYAKFVNICVSASIAKDKHNKWEIYPYFTDEEVFSGRLSDYAHSFDAALVTYNITRPSERFRSTLPTRFFAALAAGLPIAVKGGLFNAVESFVTKYDIGFVFYSEEDLHEKLSNTEKLRQQKENVIKLLPVFSAENQARVFKGIFERLAEQVNII